MESFTKLSSKNNDYLYNFYEFRVRNYGVRVTAHYKVYDDHFEENETSFKGHPRITEEIFLC